MFKQNASACSVPRNSFALFPLSNRLSYQKVRSVPADQSTAYVTISSLVTAIIQQDYTQKVRPLVRPRTERIIAQVKRERCTVVKDERDIKGGGN